MISIEYGYGDKYKGITDVCMNICRKGDILILPKSELTRATLFGDPCPGILKHIKITFDTQQIILDQNTNIYFRLSDNTVVTPPLPYNKGLLQNIDDTTLDKIHDYTQFIYGSMRSEIPEQRLALKYITADNVVLELGGNVGCNSTLIGSIVDHLVVIEPDLEIAKKLEVNRDANGYNFHIETAALSTRKLIRNGWHTLPEKYRTPTSHEVDTISYTALCNKYGLTFDTLVIDCEGAFYYILQDMPNILDTIKLVVMENDYIHITHKQYVDNALNQNGFHITEQHPLEPGGWPDAPCKSCFYEVWKRT